jgi:hypothetical protein
MISASSRGPFSLNSHRKDTKGTKKEFLTEGFDGPLIVLVLERVVPGVRCVHRSELLAQIGHDGPDLASISWTAVGVLSRRDSRTQPGVFNPRCL